MKLLVFSVCFAGFQLRLNTLTTLLLINFLMTWCRSVLLSCICCSQFSLYLLGFQFIFIQHSVVNQRLGDFIRSSLGRLIYIFSSVLSFLPKYYDSIILVTKISVAKVSLDKAIVRKYSEHRLKQCESQAVLSDSSF